MRSEDIFTTDVDHTTSIVRSTFSLGFVQVDLPDRGGSREKIAQRNAVIRAQGAAIQAAADRLEELIRGDEQLRTILAGSSVRILLTGLSH